MAITLVIIPTYNEKENSKILAGGQSLGPMLNFRYVMPDHLIDLNTVSTLDFIHFDDSIFSIGAMTRQRTLERNLELKKLCPIFYFIFNKKYIIVNTLSNKTVCASVPMVMRK